MSKLICVECGSTGQGGAVEYSDGKVYHFRKPWPKDGTVRSIMCSGKFVPCPTCDGSGVDTEGRDHEADCPTCGRKG